MLQQNVSDFKKNGENFLNSFSEIYSRQPELQPKEIAQETTPELSLYYCLSESLAIARSCTQKSRELSLVITKLEEAAFWAGQMP